MSRPICPACGDDVAFRMWQTTPGSFAGAKCITADAAAYGQLPAGRVACSWRGWVVREEDGSVSVTSERPVETPDAD